MSDRELKQRIARLLAALDRDALEHLLAAFFFNAVRRNGDANG